MPKRVFVRLRQSDGWKISRVEGAPVELLEDGETFELLSMEPELAFAVHLEKE
jgi:hypothetical protein